MMKNAKSYDDVRLLNKVKNGDEFAFRVLYDTYQKHVFTLGNKILKSRSASEDVVQEVFTMIWISRHKLADIQNFRKYINTIAINLIYNQLKRQAIAEDYIKNRRSANVHQVDSGMKMIENQELHQLLLQATQQLPPQQKKAFELSRYHGLKHEQIADYMAISRETVKKHCMEAARNIKTWLKAKGIDAVCLLFFFL